MAHVPGRSILLTVMLLLGLNTLEIQPPWWTSQPTDQPPWWTNLPQEQLPIWNDQLAS